MTGPGTNPSRTIRWWHWIAVYVFGLAIGTPLYYIFDKVFPLEDKPLTLLEATFKSAQWLLCMTLCLWIIKGLGRMKAWRTPEKGSEGAKHP